MQEALYMYMVCAEQTKQTADSCSVLVHLVLYTLVVC